MHYCQSGVWKIAQSGELPPSIATSACNAATVGSQGWGISVFTGTSNSGADSNNDGGTTVYFSEAHPALYKCVFHPRKGAYNAHYSWDYIRPI